MFPGAFKFLLGSDVCTEPRKGIFLQNDLSITIWRRQEASSQHLNVTLRLLPSSLQSFEVDQRVQLKGEGRTVQRCAARKEIVYDTFLKWCAGCNLLDFTVENPDVLVY